MNTSFANMTTQVTDSVSIGNIKPNQTKSEETPQNALLQLKELYEAQLITEEYAQKRKEILSKIC